MAIETDRQTGAQAHTVIIGLSAVVIAVTDETPKVLVVRRPYAPLQSAAARAHHFMSAREGRAGAIPESSEWFGLPFGPFDPALHRTLEIGLRDWVEEQTQLRVGYVEQLYTFGDRDRYMSPAAGEPRVVSVGYLALAQEMDALPKADEAWDDWYRYFPWEDWRGGPPATISHQIRPRLERWIAAGSSTGVREQRLDRARLCFAFDDVPWDEEKVLERYELLYEAGLAAEAIRDRAEQAHRHGQDLAATPLAESPDTLAQYLGAPMQFDHRRILATAMGRLRGKLKYRPVVFELMPDTFTLLDLQKTVEAVAGIEVHKQNFRRLVERSGMVESTGHMAQTRGRPAALFRFRREVLHERSVAGMKVTRHRDRRSS